MTGNKHGLSRDIPADVKREVRQRCGFGCVLCGAAIIEYDHVDPEFADAREHSAAGIALLCPQDHAKVTRGFLSRKTVIDAMQSPKCKSQGFASEMFDIGQQNIPTLVFAGATIINTPIPVEIEGVPLLEFKQAEEPGTPFRLSGNFFNSRGELSLQIIDNEWRPSSSNWDVEATGGVIIVRDGPGHISLRLRTVPPDALVLEQLDMLTANYRITGNPEELIIEPRGGGRMCFSRCFASNCRVGFSLG